MNARQTLVVTVALGLSLLVGPVSAQPKLSFSQRANAGFATAKINTQKNLNLAGRQLRTTSRNLATKLGLAPRQGDFVHQKSWMVKNGVIMSMYVNPKSGATMKVIEGTKPGRKTTITRDQQNNVKKAKKTEWQGKYATKFTAVKQETNDGQVTTLRKAEGRNGGSNTRVKMSNGDSFMQKIWRLGGNFIQHSSSVQDGKKQSWRTGYKAPTAPN